MAKLILPDNFASISMRERYGIILEEFYNEFSVNDLVNATFEDLKTALNEVNEEPKTFVLTIKDKLLELSINVMSDWVKNDIFEDANEIQMYFPNAVLTEEQLDQVNFITVCGPAVYSYVTFALRDKYKNKYMERPVVATWLLEKGIDVKNL